ncbi:CDP-diacylglycerol diphosphatase [Roseateles sp. NT4]|uniref:CDP-diacylglycerol pyrophosphatase n=1 Tax=Roseateles sp. NT4 TaxID=3453715 RepID=UPI003EE945D8
MRTTFFAAALSLLAAASSPALADRDALWRITDTTCVPAVGAGKMPAPCARVELPGDRDHGWALIKDRRGVLQYLLLPTARIPGIESPLLLNADTPNFFALAWQSRDLLDRLHGQPLPRDTVSLALNPIPRRSQDQLHIHISCVRPELRARLAQVDLSTSWAPLQGGWLGHTWSVRRVDAETLDGINPVAEVVAQVPGAAADMSLVGISVVGMVFKDGKPGFALMATRWDGSDRTSGSAEHDVQDHDCGVLDGKTQSGAAAQLPSRDID